MPTNYIFVDFENVQPKSIEKLVGQPFQVVVFVGAKQTKIPLGLAQTLQPLGVSAEYVQISGVGPNALDFHIACYLGQMVERDPKAYFHIISKDKGFDVLVEHLRAKKIRVLRSTDIGEIPMLKISNDLKTDDKYSAILKNLKTRGNSKPRKDQTLRSTIMAMFQDKLSETEVSQYVSKLKSDKFVSVVDGKLSWARLPDLAVRSVAAI